jgi:dipeptidyl aminopeptidase/acylaminoacyl peptidase
MSALSSRSAIPMAAVACLLVAPAIAGMRCDDLTPPQGSVAPAARDITAADLVELRDIGLPGSIAAGSPLGVSPDGRSVAFQIRKARIASNDYCIGTYVLSLDGTGRLIQADQGGTWIFSPGYWMGGITPHVSGYALVVRPVWAPNGAAIAYLRKDQGPVQAWIANVDGSGARAVTRSETDVTALRWSADSHTLYFWTRPGGQAAARAIAQEALRGYHYDDRWDPSDTSAPMPIDRAPAVEHALDIASVSVRPLREDEVAAGLTQADAGMDIANEARASTNGDVARLVSVDATNVNAATTIEVDAPGGRHLRCPDPACSGSLVGLWWPTGSDTLLFLRREGWDGDQTALYSWRPGTDPARRLYATSELLSGCDIAADRLLCMSEGSLRPAHIVAIDTRSGEERTIFNPNPEFEAKTFGLVRRIRWKNALGLPAFGDLVLPPEHRTGQHHPLVVVQYDSRGFLRGGTGDAYPILLLAQAGFAVLSTQEPADYSSLRPARSFDEAIRRGVIDQADDRSKLSSLEAGVAMAVATGTIDPSRIAITGLSDGAAKARYALLHSTLFKTAIISSCCDDETALSLLGPGHSQDFIRWGYPGIADKRSDFWKAYSFLADPDAFDTPLLIQASDHEYLPTIATLAGLTERSKPIDLFVFPDEHHVLWQPAHRAAAYQRDIDWLNFWLLNTVSPGASPERATEIASWKSMRDRWLATRHGPGQPIARPTLPHRKAGAGASRRPVKAALARKARFRARPDR